MPWPPLFRDWDRGGHRRFGGDNQPIAPPPQSIKMPFFLSDKVIFLNISKPITHTHMHMNDLS